MFVVYEIISRDIHLPVDHFHYLDEAEKFIVEQLLADKAELWGDPSRYYVVFSKEIPDYESKKP